MTNIILLIACILCGYACGKYVEKRVKRKGEFFADLYRYAASLKANVDGRRVELDKFNDEFTSGCSSVFRSYLVEGKIKCSLSAVQKSNITNFFRNLSCASSKELTEHLEYFSTQFESESKVIFENEVSKASVYVKLGILLGAMIGIVFM